MLLLQYLPLAVMARDSLYRFSLYNPSEAEFTGTRNYKEILSDPEVLQSFGFSLVFIAGVVALVLPFRFLIAVFLNGRVPGRAIVRTLVLLPVVTSQVVVATMWTFMLGRQGLFNSVLGALGIEPVSFLANKHLALLAIIIMTVWQQVGLACVIFLGGAATHSRGD
jgi:ABC-type sugar transport system permease subunit